jgi:hypothetical protein
MKKSISFDIGFFILESGIRTELLRALMAMKQKSVASEEKFLSPEILGEKESLPLRIIIKNLILWDFFIMVCKR